MATAQPTTNHDEIRAWVEARGGQPARVKATGEGEDPGILRIDFPGFSGEDTLDAIEWDEFFEWFDRNGLALLLSDEEGNRFNKIVSRETVAESSASSSNSAKKRSTATRKAGATKKASGAKKASATKKASSAKSSTKKSSAKKATTKKSTSSTAKKSSTKKASSRKATTKKAAPRKQTAKKTSAKKATGKAPTRKAATKPSSRKAATTKSTAAKRTSPRKPTKKTTKTTKAAKRPASRSTSTKKAATKKSPAKKSSAKKSGPSAARRAVNAVRSMIGGSRKGSGKGSSKQGSKASSRRGSGSSVTTTDRKEIRQWVEARGGFPAHVKKTGTRKGDLGVLRIDYPGYSGKDTLERVSWDAWFKAFDRNKLAFLYQDKKNSRFSKLVAR